MWDAQQWQRLELAKEIHTFIHVHVQYGFSLWNEEDFRFLTSWHWHLTLTHENKYQEFLSLLPSAMRFSALLHCFYTCIAYSTCTMLICTCKWKGSGNTCFFYFQAIHINLKIGNGCVKEEEYLYWENESHAGRKDYCVHQMKMNMFTTILTISPDY